MKRSPISVLAVLTLVTGLLVGAALPAPPAYAAARVEVTNDRGGDQADLTYQTRLTIRGNGFQTVRGGFGGVYLMFGWVRDPQGGAWKPTRGGLTGQDYRYIPDSEDAADNKGYLKFIAFPGSSTAGEAAAVLSPDGSFSVDLTVPGPVFQSVDRNGEIAEVDCRKVTCGVITIGAHGVKNGRNESFTPVRFGNVYDAAPAPEPEPTEPAPDTTTEAPATAPQTSAPQAAAGNPQAPVVAAGPAAVVVDRATAVSGRAMVFNARGFTPGEQVVAILDDGVAAIGPMTAGSSGEVAGVLQLSLDVGVGTHELRVTGAASGTAVTQRFPVAAPDDDAPVAAAATPADDDDRASTVFLVVAVAVFLLAVGALLLQRLRRRRRPVAGAPAAGVVA